MIAKTLNLRDEYVSEFKKYMEHTYMEENSQQPQPLYNAKLYVSRMDEETFNKRLDVYARLREFHKTIRGETSC